jgi:hypothetical protein
MEEKTEERGILVFIARVSRYFREKPWLRRGLMGLVIVVPMMFLVRNLITNWQEMLAAQIHFDAWRMVFSLLGLFLAFALFPLGTQLCLRILGTPISYLEAYYGYHASQLGKYLPGRVWIIPGRAVTLSRFQVDPVLAGVGTIMEMIFLISAGIIVFIPFLFFTSQSQVQQLAIFGLVMSIAGLVVLFIPGVLNWALSILLKALKRPVIHLDYRWHQMLVLILVYLIFWLAAGSGLYYLINSFYVLDLCAFLPVIGVMGFSWVLGTLSFITPAGMGVREGAMSLLLSSLLPAPFPALIAIAARFWWSLADFGSIGLAFLLSAFVMPPQKK